MFKNVLTAAAATLTLGAAAQGQTLVSTFNVTVAGGPNANVEVAAADLAPGFVPVALGAGDTVSNVAGNGFGDVGGGITLAGDFTGNAQAGFTFSRAADANDNPIFLNYTAATNGFGPATVDSTLTFSGLSTDADTTYDIYLLATGDTVGQGSVFTLDGTSLTTLATDVTTSAAELGNNFVVFEDVVADATGNVAITISDIGTGFLVLSGGQIVENVVPEPASLALLGLGGLAVLGRRRRA